MMDVAIAAEALTKEFVPARGWQPTWWRDWRGKTTADTITAVADVSLTVPQGTIFGLLGPNGAGKTTLVKMLCTLIRPSAGSATVAGHPLKASGAIRAAVGLVVSDDRSFYWRLSARRNLDFFAAMHGLNGRLAQQRIASALTDVNLLDVADRRFSAFSGGMKQRLAIARALLHHPQLLFLDEPSRSLDPTATRRLHDLLRRLRHERGITIFLVTHDLAEAEALCGRVALMHRGRVRTVGQPTALRRQLRPQRRYTLTVAGGEPVPFPTGYDIEVQRGEGQTTISFQAGKGDGRVTAVLDQLRQRGITILQIESTPPSLEEVFHHFTQDD